MAKVTRLPSLVVDRYDRWLVVQILSAGLETMREPILQALTETFAAGGDSAAERCAGAPAGSAFPGDGPGLRNGSRRRSRYGKARSGTWRRPGRDRRPARFSISVPTVFWPAT